MQYIEPSTEDLPRLLAEVRRERERADKANQDAFTLAASQCAEPYAFPNGDAGCGKVMRLEARVAELEGIVRRLPKTADGVPITPFMKVFYITSSRNHLGELQPQTIKSGTWGSVSSDIGGRNRVFYSTHAAAEAAKGGGKCYIDDGMKESER